MVELRNVTVTEKKEILIEHASLKLNNGKKYGICATEKLIILLTDLFSGVRIPTAGSVVINGFDMKKESKKAKSFISLMPSLCAAFDCMSVLESLLFVADVKGMEYQKAVRKIADLLLVTELSHRRNTLVKNLSNYEKKRLSLAMATLKGDEIVVLTSPFSSLSSSEQKSFESVLENVLDGRTVILTDTDTDVARRLCDSVFLLEENSFTPIPKEDRSKTSHEEEEQI